MSNLKSLIVATVVTSLSGLSVGEAKAQTINQQFNRAITHLDNAYTDASFIANNAIGYNQDQGAQACTNLDYARTATVAAKVAFQQRDFVTAENQLVAANHWVSLAHANFANITHGKATVLTAAADGLNEVGVPSQMDSAWGLIIKLFVELQ